ICVRYATKRCPRRISNDRVGNHNWEATAMNKTQTALPMAVASLAALVCAHSPAFAAADAADALAQTIMQQAGIRATVCELPRVGDGTLAAALARQGIIQVHG